MGEGPGLTPTIAKEGNLQGNCLCRAHMYALGSPKRRCRRQMKLASRLTLSRWSLLSSLKSNFFSAPLRHNCCLLSK